MLGEAFIMCIACSPNIVDAFWKSEDEQFEFLLKACKNPNFLEDQTGLSQKLKDIKLDDFDDFIDFEEDEMVEGD